MDTQHLLAHDIELSSIAGTEDPTVHSIGIPGSKKSVALFDVLLAVLSIICLGVALASIINNTFSWYLGQGTNQLILLGLLLSIMNLCLSSVTTTFFLLLEASFGPSTLQNYEGILRNQITASKLHICWRLLIGLMIALPLTLSVAYKTFTGGESFRTVNATEYTGNISYYGMFGLPGLQDVGQRAGLALFFNISMPFFTASTPSPGGPEPKLPEMSKSFGLNTLILNNATTAVLDIPQPAYLTAVQSQLADGESWNISASVFGTVASLNASKSKTPKAWNDTFQNDCRQASQDNGFWSQNMFNGWAVVLINNPGFGNQSRQYFGLPPSQPSYSCANLSHYIHQFDITRRACQGAWQIKRGSILLTNGYCESEILPPDKQLIYTANTLLLGGAFLQGLLEVLGSFSDRRNRSDWAIPSYTTAMAAMMWSKITSLDGANKTGWATHGGLSAEQAGLAYSVNDIVRYIRPTLQKSPVLYVLLALQPVLLITMLGFTWRLSTAPLGKGFGLVTILSGIDHRTLNILSGASLSGKLEHSIKLSLQPTQDGDRIYIKYSVLLSQDSNHNGNISSKILYS